MALIRAPRSHFKRLAAWVSSFAILCCASAFAQVPQPPEIAARSYLLMDVSSGQDLAALNADAPMEPASLTKLMAAHLAFQSLRDKHLELQQEIAVSERAWRIGLTESTRMFVETGSKVKVDDLLKGMIVLNGNDATVVLSEAVAGSVEAFVERMNRQAQAWGLRSTVFKNPEGSPVSGHVSTARDLAAIAAHLITDFPEHLHYFSTREYGYGGSRPQQNRNVLLWRDPSIEGMQTSYTETAGYCMIASARRDFPNGPRRLLGVMLGTASREARAAESQKLLNWGFTAFDSLKLFDAGQAMATPQVWKGAHPTVRIGSPQPVTVTVPRGDGAQIKSSLQRTEPLVAPLKQGQRVGTLRVSAGSRTLSEVPVTVLEPVDSAGFFQRSWDGLQLLFKRSK